MISFGLIFEFVPLMMKISDTKFQLHAIVFILPDLSLKISEHMLERTRAQRGEHGASPRVVARQIDAVNLLHLSQDIT